MRRPHRAGSVLTIVALLVAAPAAHAEDPFQDAVDILLSQQPVAEEKQQTPRDPCLGPHETKVFRLAPTPELARLVETLLDDPFTMPMEHNGISVVILARPLPCGEKLVSASVELWDSLALKRRSGATRFFYRLSGMFRKKNPTLWEVVFPDDGVARKAQKGYKLTRKLEFGRNSPWMGTMNGYGVVVLAVTSNTISGATLSFKTEKLVARKKGKKPRRVVSRRSGTAVALPGPGAPMSDPDKIREGLGIRRGPGRR